MSIPSYQATMLPLLQLLAKQPDQVHYMPDVYNQLSDHFNLTEEERNALLPSGAQKIINNRIGWARTHLQKAGLLIDPKRSYTQITPLGLELLSSQPAELSTKFLLDNFENFRIWQLKSKDKVTQTHPSDIDEEGEKLNDIAEKTPTELMSSSFTKLQSTLADEILDTILSREPSFFEQLVIDLITKMGYGGFSKDAAHVTQSTRDGGIDGIIKEDKLGLSHIYLQAKRYTDSAVSSPEVQKFAGALMEKGSKKGIFITTSYFTKEALAYANKIAASNTNIVLVDGDHLAQLMIEYNLGVSVQTTYEIKRIDSDYFDPS